jgi:hypothetical protein
VPATAPVGAEVDLEWVAACGVSSFFADLHAICRSMSFS